MKKITVRNAERSVFGTHAKGFSIKSKKEPGIDQPKPRVHKDGYHATGKKFLY